MLNFQWDAGNTSHSIQDHTDRENTAEEVESLFGEREQYAQITQKTQ